MNITIPKKPVLSVEEEPWTREDTIAHLRDALSRKITTGVCRLCGQCVAACPLDLIEPM